MSQQNKLSAELRTEFGKGAARRLRRADQVPAVMYGHGTDPIHISLPGHETLLALRTANAVLSIAVDGKEQLALAKQVQRDPIKGFIEHVDFIIVKRGEKVTVDVAVVVTGEAGPETVVVVDNTTVSLEVPATDIPESVEVSVEGMEYGSQVLAQDLKLPSGATLVTDPETLIVNITQQQSAEALEAELAEAEAEAGIEREESDAEAEESAESAEDGESTDSDEGDSAE
ncbi:50S ribosomal protein L25/general stress protein Ctc [Enemella dayhoffiae]|uniref:Large ribosomal subunit protein bL25 n=1 Tax=Enemella dayhoffiae TaxID=2016507 RepID=A0A255GQL2_9ACTN|nr:50S ribosomal protein L25/general stress protein Ctc [Enemella dayhoffiae]OYO18089.1 50S ribosomal protein L25/general stress protein Ctc [Enemella dayhoffiae]